MSIIPKNPANRIWLGLFLAFFLPMVMAVSMLWYGKITPPELTQTCMSVTKRRIVEFAQKNGRLPANLDELPPAYDSLTSDAWGRPFDYTVDAAGVVTLRSLGADRAPGGTGDNADILGIFATRDAEGGWVRPGAAWIKDPRKP